MSNFKPDWVSEDDKNIIGEVFETEIDDGIKSASGNCLENLVKEYIDSDEKDAFKFVFDRLLTKCQEHMFEIVNYNNEKLQKIKEKLGNRTLEQAYADNSIEDDPTGYKKRNSMTEAFVGSLMECIVDRIVAINLAAFLVDGLSKLITGKGIGLDRANINSSLDDFREEGAKLFAAIIAKNDYKYDDIELEVFRGKTIEEIYEILTGPQVDEFEGDKFEKDKLQKAVDKFREDLNDFDMSQYSMGNIVEFYYKNKVLDELKEKIGTIELKHVEPNEGKKEVEWTEGELKLKAEIDKAEEKKAKLAEMESRIRELVKAAGNNEELLRKIEAMVKENK